MMKISQAKLLYLTFYFQSDQNDQNDQNYSFI